MLPQSLFPEARMVHLMGRWQRTWAKHMGNAHGTHGRRSVVGADSRGTGAAVVPVQLPPGGGGVRHKRGEPRRSVQHVGRAGPINASAVPFWGQGLRRPSDEVPPHAVFVAGGGQAERNLKG